jgi:hypothetical protein
VLYNATLQGDLFSANDPYVLSYKELTKIVFQSELIVGCFWQNLALSYSHNFLTKEFNTGTNHDYAGIKLAVSF